MQRYMNMCLELARKGQGKTSPNPLVGCVVLNKSGEIISTGYHAKYGEKHAERDALSKIKVGDAKGGTLFVNLEPCSHYGKTPPCTDLIVKHGIKTVVIGMRDPNPKVDGISVLRKSGIEVIEGVMEDECRKLNEIFIVNQEKHRAFVAIKTATTLDGKIATSNGSSKWITSEISRKEVRQIRKKYDAILTSSSTINSDNPHMVHARKIILDRKLTTDLNSRIYAHGYNYVYHDEALNRDDTERIMYIKTPIINGKLDIDFILQDLWKRNILSVMVESGGKMNGTFVPYADKIYDFIAPKIIGDNKAKSAFDYREVFDISEAEEFELVDIVKFLPDVLLILKKKN